MECVTPADAASERLRVAARAWVYAALAQLQLVNVIPRPPFDPHARCGVNFFGEHLADVPVGELYQAMNEASARFAPSTPGGLPDDFENLYTYSLLEACVSEVNIRGTVGRLDHPELEPIIDEFVEAVRSAEAHVAVCRVVGHLSTADEHAMHIGDVQVLPVVADSPYADRRQRQLITSIIPTASREYDQVGDTLSSPTSLIVATRRCRAGVRPETTDAPIALRRQVDELLLALDLAFGGTFHSVREICGPTRRVSGVPTTFDAAPPTTLSVFWHRRVVRLEAGASVSIPAVIRLVSDAAGPIDRETVHPLRYALHRFVRSKYEHSALDAMAELAISLDSALLEGDITRGKREALGTRTSLLLYSASESQFEIKSDVLACYTVRNSVAHGDKLELREIANCLRSVSTVPGGAADLEVLATALDRFRDLTRRALLARLILAASEAAGWPVPTQRNDPIAKTTFATEDLHSAWRRQVHDWLGTHGLGHSMNPCLPFEGPDSWRNT